MTSSKKRKYVTHRTTKPKRSAADSVARLAQISLEFDVQKSMRLMRALAIGRIRALPNSPQNKATLALLDAFYGIDSEIDEGLAQLATEVFKFEATTQRGRK